MSSVGEVSLVRGGAPRIISYVVKTSGRVAWEAAGGFKLQNFSKRSRKLLYLLATSAPSLELPTHSKVE